MSFSVPGPTVLHKANQRSLQPLQEIAEKGARAAGTPFLSFFTPEATLALAREAGFKEVEMVSSRDITQRYFAGRTDNLLPASREVFLVATT